MHVMGKRKIFCVCMHMHVTGKRKFFRVCMHACHGQAHGAVQNSSCMYHMGLPRIFFFFLINLKFEKN